MILKGYFKYGLKSGEWYRWYSNGKLKEITTWDEGRRNGVSVGYDKNSKIIFDGNFRENKLNGVCTRVENDSIFQFKYRYGKILKRKFIDVF